MLRDLEMHVPMKASYEVRDGYVYVAACGTFSLSLAQESFFTWLDMAQRHGLKRAVVDIRNLQGFDDTLAGTLRHYAIGKFIGVSLPKDFKLAVLQTAEQLGNRFSEQVMLNLGAAVKMTLTLREALEWLGVPSRSTGRGTDRE